MSTGLHEERTRVNLERAKQLHVNGKTEEARKLLELTLLELDPENAEAHWRLGLIYEEKGDGVNALREFRIAARNGIVSEREQEYLQLRNKLKSLANFTQNDLSNLMQVISSINGTIHPVAMDHILDNFEIVKKEILRIWNEDLVTDGVLISAFDNLKGTFAIPGLISNILFIKSMESFNICTSKLLDALAKIGLFEQAWNADGASYLAYNKIVNGFKSAEHIKPEAVDWLLTYVSRIKDMAPMIWEKSTPESISRISAENWWLEKTIVEGRPDRLTGEVCLGKALWSPQRDQRGADIYKNMRFVKKGDLILHLIDNKNLVGVSVVEKECDSNFTCLLGTEWDDGIGKRPGYIVHLTGFVRFDKPVDRSSLLNENHKNELLSILDSEDEVFYNKNLELRQGAYLTSVPNRLLGIINNEFRKMNGQDLPYLKTEGYPTKAQIEKAIVDIGKNEIDKTDLLKSLEKIMADARVRPKEDWKEKTWENIKRWAERITE